MHTETNNLGTGEEEATRWLWRQFFNVRLLHSEGAPVLGFTWYSLTDQMDWDVALRDERGMVNPVGLFDLNERAEQVAATYGSSSSILPAPSTIQSLNISQRLLTTDPDDRLLKGIAWGA